MAKNKLLKKLLFESKVSIASIILVSNPLVWYYTINTFFENTLTKTALTPAITNIVWATHYLGIIISILVGASIAKKIELNKLLKSWIIIGAISTTSIFLVHNSSVLGLNSIAFLLGVSFGIGLPACMRYFNNKTPIEKRGKVSGLILLTFVIGLMLMNFLPFDVFIVGSVLFAIRLLSLISFRLKLPSPLISTEDSKPIKNTVSYKSILKQNRFISYFMPWVIFSLVNYLTVPIQSNLLNPDVIADFMIIQTGLIGIFAVIGGYFIDRFGRKYVAVSGFIIFGAGTSILAIFPGEVISWYISAVSGGITWGFFFVLFVLTIWGDLSGYFQSDKYYALGATPFFVSSLLGIIAGPYISEKIEPLALFSFTAFFLFLAVFPLFFAPETLPDKIMKDRDLNSYVEKAKKIVEKENTKIQKKKKTDNQIEDSDEESKESSEDEKARKLAEKYY